MDGEAPLTKKQKQQHAAGVVDEDDAASLHRLNLYRYKRPDFAQLAQRHAALMPFLVTHRRQRNEQQDEQHSANLDWSDPRALIELTRALLHDDFDLHVELPVDNLCPTVTSRLAYLLYMSDLLQCGPMARLDVQAARYDRVPMTRTVVGLDIGTGASAIYPLLGARVFGWSWIATELSEASLLSARENIKRNGLEDWITVFRAPTEDTAIWGAVPFATHASFTFTVCNPPFFEDHDSEAAAHPQRNTAILPNESATTGGEVAFISRIIDDSVRAPASVQWFSSLCGKKASLKPLKQRLWSTPGIKGVRSTRLAQGRVHRWVLAWTFREDCAAVVADSSTSASSLSSTPSHIVTPSSVRSSPITIRTDEPRRFFDRAVSFLQGYGMPVEKGLGGVMRLTSILGTPPEQEVFRLELTILGQHNTWVINIKRISGDAEMFSMFESMILKDMMESTK